MKVKLLHCTLLSLVFYLAPLPRAEARPEPLVEVQSVVPSIRVDLRYATKNNFLGRVLYSKARALLRRSVARRLAKAQRWLKRRGHGLLILDAYRPLSVQRAMWKVMPDPRYVARVSKHNRGAAVDLTLVDAQGNAVPMPTPFDEASPRARFGARKGVSAAARKNAALLRRAMRHAGFVPYNAEWWHFNAPDWRRHPISDLPL